MIAAWGVVHWILLGLSGAGIVGSLLARRWSLHATLVLSACGFFFLASAMLGGSLVGAERGSGHLRDEIAVMTDPAASTAAKAEARKWADINLSEIGERNIESAVDGVFFGLAALYLALAIFRPGMLLSPTARDTLAAEKTRKAQAAGSAA